MKDRTKTYIRLTVFLFVLLLFSIAVVYGMVPPKINYQGYLTDSSGNPINDPVLVTFRIYTAPEGGTPLWEEEHYVTPENGVYSVVLGTGILLDLDYSQSEFYLGIEVGTDGEMIPRQELTSVGASHTAFRALNLVCSGCISNAEVNFNYAQSTSKGGPATNLECAGCVSAPEVNTAEIQRRVAGTCGAGNSIRVINQDGSVTCELDDIGWGLTGNAGTTSANFIGTTDNKALRFRVNNAVSFGILPHSTSPNLIGGQSEIS